MAEKIFTDQNFKEEVLGSDMPVLVDFFATWCGPCQMMGPVIEELAKEYEGKVKIGKLDIDANQETPGNYGIMSVPTLIIFKGGEMVDKSVGLQTKEELKKKIEANL